MSGNGNVFSQNTSFPTYDAISFTVFNNRLYVGTNGFDIYTSTDGITFIQNISFPSSASIYSFTVFNNMLYAGTDDHGIYTSTDGITFIQNTSIPSTYDVRALTVFNNMLYAGTNHGIYMSTDGITFIRNTSIPLPVSISSFTVFNNMLYVGTFYSYIYTSPGISSAVTLSGISELLFTQLRSAAGPIGLKSVHIDSSNHLIIVAEEIPAQAIIEYTKTT